MRRNVERKGRQVIEIHVRIKKMGEGGGRNKKKNEVEKKIRVIRKENKGKRYGR